MREEGELAKGGGNDWVVVVVVSWLDGWAEVRRARIHRDV